MKLHLPFFTVLLSLGIVPAAVAQSSFSEQTDLEQVSRALDETSSSSIIGQGAELPFLPIAAIASETLLSPAVSKALPSRSKEAQPKVPLLKIPSKSNLEPLLTEVKSPEEPSHPEPGSSVSVAQAESVIPVTGVRLNCTPRGLEVILETPGDGEPRVFKTRYGNTLAIDVLNTQLRLPEAREFHQNNPSPGLASVRVVQQDPNSIH